MTSGFFFMKDAILCCYSLRRSLIYRHDVCSRGDSLIWHLFQRVMIASNQTFNWVSNLQRWFVSTADVRLQVELACRLFVQRDTEGVVLKTNAVLIMNKLHTTSFCFRTIHGTVSNVDHRTHVYIHLFVCSTLSSFVLSLSLSFSPPIPSGHTGDWLINIDYIWEERTIESRASTFERHARTLMAWHWQHRGLLVR